MVQVIVKNDQGSVVYTKDAKEMNAIILGNYCRSIGKVKSNGRYYAVHNKETGHKAIYGTWDETKKHTNRVKNVRHKSFGTQEEAQWWLSNPDEPYLIESQPHVV